MTYSKNLYLKLEKIQKGPIKYFEKLSRKEKMKFIGGLFDAETTVTDRLVIYNSNKKLLRAFKRFLEELGIIYLQIREGV